MTENGKQCLDSDEETLSLCDLPVAGTLHSSSRKDGRTVETPPDFQFYVWGGSGSGSGSSSSLLSIEMCAADDVFFEGQILPVRPSVSSDNGYIWTGNGQQEKENPRSDSLERYGSWSFSSSYSRGSSSSSSSAFEEKQRIKGGSSSPSIRSSSSRSEGREVYKRFYACPSPKPQVYFPGRKGNQTGRVSFSGSRRSTMGLFRPGLLRTPEIELNDLKLRQKRNGEMQESTIITLAPENSGGNINCGGGNNNGIGGKKKKKGLSWGLFSDGFTCKCSATAVETVPSRVVVIKSKQSSEDKERIKLELQAKRSVSNHRTYEWLKELSTADAPET